MAGIRRRLGAAPAQKAPVLVADLRAMVTALPDTVIGRRDRALVLVGWCGAFRRSELAALEVGDLAFDDRGLVVTLRKSKTDQEGLGRKVPVPYGRSADTCPVRALRAWLEAAGITSGRVFRRVDRGRVGASLTAHGVARVVKKLAGRVGLNVSDFSGHSLRAGLVTSAALAGVVHQRISKVTGHRNGYGVSLYVRPANDDVEHAANAAGL